MPPETVAVNVAACPATGLAGLTVKLAVRVSGETVIVADCVAVLWVGVAESVTVRLIVNVPFVA